MTVLGAQSGFSPSWSGRRSPCGSAWGAWDSLACHDDGSVAQVLDLLSGRAYAGLLALKALCRQDLSSSRDLVDRIVNGKRRT